MPAERLEDKEPLAASLLYRIDFPLDHGRSKRYGHAARHSCRALARPLIADWQGHQPHADYAEGLRQRHRHKSGFDAHRGVRDVDGREAGG